MVKAPWSAQVLNQENRTNDHTNKGNEASCPNQSSIFYRSKKDLGRPGRFHHMFRILKLRSAMSLGTWAITVFGICCGLTTAHQLAKDGLLNWFPLLARFMKAFPVTVIEVIGSVFGLVVASYT